MMAMEVRYTSVNKGNRQLNRIKLGSTIAQHTGQTLHHVVLKSPFFEKKEYAKAMTQAFLQLDKELQEGTLVITLSSSNTNLRLQRSKLLI